MAPFSEEETPTNGKESLGGEICLTRDLNHGLWNELKKTKWIYPFGYASHSIS